MKRNTAFLPGFFILVALILVASVGSLAQIQPPAETAAPPQTEAPEGKMAAPGEAKAAASDASPTPPQPPPRYVAMPPPPIDPDEFRVSSDVELVLLDVSVKNEEGGFVSGLAKDRFKVFENKLEQAISVFAAQDVPVTVGLVVDNSGSVRPKKPEIVTAALVFARASNPQDEMFIVHFNDRVKLGLPPETPFTDDRNMLRHSLLTNPAQGRTALYDALKLALTHIDKGRKDKKTLVLIADGGDNASDTTKEEILRLVEESPVTIYTVGIFNPEDKDKNPGFLRRLANMTGGEAFMPENIDHLVGVCEKIAHDIRNRYTVGFSPAHHHDGGMRKLLVTAKGDDGKRLVVRTRTHYIAAREPSVESHTDPKKDSKRARTR